jgi:hypothetical protein
MIAEGRGGPFFRPSYPSCRRDEIDMRLLTVRAMGIWLIDA